MNVLRNKYFSNYAFRKCSRKHMIYFSKVDGCIFHGVIVTEIASGSLIASLLSLEMGVAHKTNKEHLYLFHCTELLMHLHMALCCAKA